jgi:hypothetical protein
MRVTGDKFGRIELDEPQIGKRMIVEEGISNRENSTSEWEPPRHKTIDWLLEEQ